MGPVLRRPGAFVEDNFKQTALSSRVVVDIGYSYNVFGFNVV